VQKAKFNVLFPEEASLFLDNLNEMARSKVIYNITKARYSNNKAILKNLRMKFGNLGQFLIRNNIGFLRFGTT